MDFIIGTVVDGLVLGGIYALAALGFVIIYKATGVFNFAQGQLLMVGGYLFYFALVQLELPIVLAVLAAVLVSGLLGLACYAVVMRPMATQPLFSRIVATLGIAIVLTAGISLWFGPHFYYVDTQWTGVYVSLTDGYRMSYYDVFSLAATALAFGAFLLLFTRTSLGLRMRGAAENQLLASQRGINLNYIYGLTWVLASVAASGAGMLYASRGTVSLEMAALGLSAFPAAVIGGFDSIGGTAIGAVIVGIAESAATAFFGADSSQAVAAVILVVVLFVRPSGLFGTVEAARL